MIYVEISCRCLVAIVFAFSAVAKLRSRESFRSFKSWLEQLPLPGPGLTRRYPAVPAATIAGAEVLVVLLTAAPWTVLAGFTLAAAMLVLFAAGATMAIARGTRATCACFGARGARLGAHHVARDTTLLAVAIAGAVTAGAHGARPAGIAVSVAAAVFLAILVVFLDDVRNVFAVAREV